MVSLCAACDWDWSVHSSRDKGGRQQQQGGCSCVCASGVCLSCSPCSHALPALPSPSLLPPSSPTPPHQVPSPTSCTASSPGRLATSRTSANASCAARLLTWGATNGVCLQLWGVPACPGSVGSSCECSASITHSKHTLCASLSVCAHTHRYVLIYPQGCDVCNHLSLFLCVADYDKLLPGA